MRDFRDAKAMAQTLRSTLTPKGVNLSHTESLEITARVLGAKDWNVLSALIENSRRGAELPSRPSVEHWSGPLLLMRDLIIFPKQTAPVFVGRQMSKQTVIEAGRGGLEVFIIAQKDPADDDPQREAIYDIGVIADVLYFMEIPATEQRPGVTYKMMLRGRQRARLIEISETKGLRTAEVEPLRDEDPSGVAQDQMRAVFQRMRAFGRDPAPAASTTADLGAAQLFTPVEASPRMHQVEKITRPGALADVIAQFASGTVAQKQEVLETLDPVARLARAVALLPATESSEAPAV
jgi:ATP-dependent Lon protease